MNENPYIRHGLTATRAGIPDPALLVDCWLDRLLDLYEGRGSGDLTADAYDLLATWARLRRTRTDLFGKLGRAAEWQELDHAIDEKRQWYASQAVELADPDGWRMEVDEFNKAIEGLGSDAELSLWAERLLCDLDDADLVAWAASPWVSGTNLKGMLRSCHQWLTEHVESFVLCSVYVQAIGMTLDSDLPALDLELAWTADKFVLVLDALEQAETDLAFSGSGVFAAADVRELVTSSVRQQEKAMVPIASPVFDAPSLANNPDEIFARVWQRVATIVHSLPQLGTSLVQFFDPPRVLQPVPVLGPKPAVAASMHYLSRVSAPKDRPSTNRSTSGNVKDVSLWRSFGEDALKRLESEEPGTAFASGPRDEMVQRLGEQILKERLPWAGKRLRILRVPSKADPNVATYTAEVDIGADIGGGKTKLRVILDSITGESATACLDKDCPADMLSMSTGDTLPFNWELLRPRLVIEEEAGNA